MSEDERKIELEKKTIANTWQDNIKIINFNKYPIDFDENGFIIYDEITYILSMLKFNKLILLEKTEANIFGKYINKDGFEDNYIIINSFANDILKKYLQKQ